MVYDAAGSYVPLSEGGEMYGRGGGGTGAAPLTGALSSAGLSKSSSADYSTYQQYPPAYQQDQVRAHTHTHLHTGTLTHTSTHTHNRLVRANMKTLSWNRNCIGPRAYAQL